MPGDVLWRDATRDREWSVAKRGFHPPNLFDVSRRPGRGPARCDDIDEWLRRFTGGLEIVDVPLVFECDAAKIHTVPAWRRFSPPRCSAYG